MSEGKLKTQLLGIVLLVALLPGTSAGAAESDAVVGKWDLVLVFDERDVPVVLVIEERHGKLEGTWKDPQGEHELVGFRWNGITLQFGRELSRLGRKVKIHYIGDVRDDTIEGRMLTPRGEHEFSGRRLRSPEGDR